MPQDKRRSLSYRSFVTCDDPKGVVECGAIRKNKVSSPQKREPNIKFEGDKIKVDHQNPSLAIIKEDRKEMGKGEITRELDTPASFQLVQVSKGADKLNHVNNSWSKSNAKDQQKDIARDLLKGALDLQESLAVLKKLQEASSCTTLSLIGKHKQKHEEEGRFDGMVKGVMDERVYMDFHRPVRVSVDGFSRKSFDEMRKVVRDSLLRQNVITNPIYEEHFDHRKFGSPDLPSTSSSQSSMIYSSNYAPSESSLSSLASQKKNGKGSNLIVRLMGLESLPSSPRRHKEAEKIVNMAKPVYDIDYSPRARKPQSSASETGTRQRSVDEILETLNFKGLLRSNSGHGVMPDSPPIVIIKPMKSSCQDLEKYSMPKVQDCCDSSRIKEMLMKMRSRRETAQTIVSSNKTNFHDKGKEHRNFNCEARSKYVKKVVAFEEKSSATPQKKVQKDKAAVKNDSEFVKGALNRSKGEEKKGERSSHEMRSRDQAKLTTSKVKKQKDRRLISKSQNSSEQKVTFTSTIDHTTSETSRSSSQRGKIGRPISTGKSHGHKGEKKERLAAFNEEVGSTSENDPVLPATDFMIFDHFRSEKLAEPSQIEISDYEDQSSLSATREATAYHHCSDNNFVREVVIMKTYEDSGNRYQSDDNKSSASEITSPSIPAHCNEVHLIENDIPIHEVTLKTTHENGIAVHPECSQTSTSSTQVEQDETWRKRVSPRRKLKALLLTSPSFVSHAEELFGVEVNVDLTDERTVNEDFIDSSSNKLLLDCVIEIMEAKSLQFSLVYPPLPRMHEISNPRMLSIDQLLEDICNGIENLRCYLRPADGEISSADNLYTLQDRDLKYVSRTWDIGWRNVFSQDEVEKVIGDIDKIVLGKLVEEVIVDFML